MDEQAPAQAETEQAEAAPGLPPGTPPAPPVYPNYYQPSQTKASIDTATLALILAAAGLMYWCPPFVLPGVALYLVGKAKREIEAGMPVAPNAATFIKVARVLAIVGIVVTALIFVLYIVMAILGIALDN